MHSMHGPKNYLGPNSQDLYSPNMMYDTYICQSCHKIRVPASTIFTTTARMSLDLLPHVKFIRTLCTDNHALFYGVMNNMNFNDEIYYNIKKIGNLISLHS